MRDNIRDTISAVVFGTLAVAVVQGTLGGLMFWWLGLPAPILWGAIMAVLAILPLFGAALIWVPAALYLAINGEWDKALLLTAWGTIVVGLIDNLLYPLLVKNKLRIHTVPVFIAVLGGLFAFGATGVVLGPLILAVALALVDIWRRRMALGAIEEGVNKPPKVRRSTRRVTRHRELLTVSSGPASRTRSTPRLTRPATTNRSPRDALWRSASSGRYSGEFHHAFARSTLGNSSTTMRFGTKSPSSASTAPPRTRKRPPYFSIVAGTSLR